ncbi:RpiB/LacA/LacB family sugar-phosphate isomerase [Varibaculum prostatecancerukia]
MAKAEDLGHEVKDFGSDDPIYANVAVAVAEAVAAGEYDRGVVVCGTGIGVSIAANKVKGAYCACIADVYQAQRATLSNNANMIAIGSQVVGIKSAEVFLEEYLKNDFDPNSRSKDKVARICEYEAE